MNSAAINEKESGKAKRPSGLSWAIDCSAMIALLMMDLAILVFIVPSFEAMFRDIGHQLPRPTEILISASQSVRSPPGIVLSAVALGLAWIGLYRQPWSREAADALIACVVLAVFILLGVMIVALFLPLSGGIIKSVGN